MCIFECILCRITRLILFKIIFAYSSPQTGSAPPPACFCSGNLPGSSSDLPNSEEDLCTVKVCVSPADSIGVGQRVQICKQVEPRWKVHGAGSWSLCGTIKPTINANQPFRQQRGSAFGSSPTELVLPVVGALVGFWSEPDVWRACSERHWGNISAWPETVGGGQTDRWTESIMSSHNRYWCGHSLSISITNKVQYQ